MDRRALPVVLLLALILVAGSFAFADFQAMESTTDASNTVSTARSNDATAPQDAPLTLGVFGEGPAADRFGAALASNLADTWTVERSESLSDTDGPILVVDVTDREIGYNPFVPSARVSAAFAFVGSGNATLAAGMVTGERPVVLTNQDPYAVEGEVTVEDRSRGIVSWPGYQRHVTEGLAASVVRALTSAPGM